IDLVVQLGSPKSVTRAIQRVGRAGHRLGEVSKGIFICSDRDDAVEVAIMLKEAMSGHLDRAHMPRNALDVLAQHIAGMAIEQKWNVEEAYELVRRAYPYKDLNRKDFEEVLKYLSGAYSQMEKYKVYGKIWYDPEEGVFGRRGKLARAIYSQNVGTIPDEVRVRVRTISGRRIGSIEEEFLERLMPGDRFVLGGKVYEFVKTLRGFTAVVMPAYDEKPTVPSWFSEMLPLSYDLALEISRFRGKMFEWLENGVDEGEIVEWIMRNCRADENIANAILQYFKEELLYLKSRGVSKYPSDRVLLVEVFVDEDGKKYVVYHALFGRRVNDALSRAVAYLAGRRVRRNLGIIVGDHGFAIVYPPGVQVHCSYLMDIKPEDLPEILRKAIERTELFERRFRHVATRGLMLLRRYKGVETSIRRRQLNAKKILNLIREIEDFPLVKETYREILEDVMDVKNAMEVLSRIQRGEIEVIMLPPTRVPSPFSHNIVLQGMSDVVLMESKRQMLARLHNMVMKMIEGKSHA
ncbi:MAG: ATP-dependent helicase, partial [Thermoproteota archaeon]